VGRCGAETGTDRDATLREALAAYQKAIDLKPNDAAFHNNYGLALARSNKFPEAQAELAKAAQLDPPQAGKYYFNLGAVLVNNGQVDPAVAAFRKAIEADATYSEAYFQLGMCLFSIKRTNTGMWPDGTQQAFQKYLELKPDGSNAATARARLQEMSQPAVRAVDTPVMAKKGACPYPDAPPAVDRFLSTDSIMLWFRVEGLSDDDTISIRYTDPSGAVSREEGATFKPTSRSHSLCSGLKNPATMTPGKWSVAAYLNNASTPLFMPLTFTITRAEPQSVTVVGTPVMSRFSGPCPANAPPAATQFLSTDRTFTFWFKVAGLSADDSISVRHIEPNGETSRVYGHTFSKPGAGTRSYCVSKANPATMPPGTWSMAAYLNNSPTPLFPPLVFTLQRATVRPPAPLAEDANLETTMKFIEDGLNAKGRVEFRDPAPGTNAADSALFFDEVTGAAADPARCELSFHLLFGSAGGTDTLIKFRFADVDNLSVVPRHAQPPVFMLQPHTKTEAVLEHHVAMLRKDPTTNLFLATASSATPRPDQQRVGTTVYFSDEAAAQSMAVAMVHAVELCGGGSQDQ
jgi:Tfp pilus assembly protein PilF